MLIDTSPSPVESVAGKAHVLVVDDEYGPRESIAFTLATEFTVDAVDRASEAMDRLRRQPFDVVILDIRMPEMDGITALEGIRKIDPEVSVVMLTGYGTLHTAQQAILGGANQYLRKPPDINELLEAVRQQAVASRIRRKEARANRDARAMNLALKEEITRNEPNVWQGRAAVELVHDLSNPLTTMIGYAALLSEEARHVSKRDSKQAEKMLDYASVVERAAEYCHQLAENWRQATRKATDFADVDLAVLVVEVKKVLFFNNPIIQVAADKVAIVRGSRFELARVFQNLIKNSLEAGATTLRVSFVEEGGAMKVALTDNGAGMTAEVARSTTKRGFSTKAHGTGLGLSICRHLLGIHGASLTIESEPGRGSTLHLIFPAKK